MWQLRDLITGENLNDPQPLPENWGPIFGMQGYEDKLGDLSWLGDKQLYKKGWVKVGLETIPEPVRIENSILIPLQIEKILSETVDKVAADNLEITRGERADWIEYRRLVRAIPRQPGYPDKVRWPIAPK